MKKSNKKSCETTNMGRNMVPANSSEYSPNMMPKKTSNYGRSMVPCNGAH